MPRRHALARKKITIHYTLAERKRLRNHQRKHGPSAVRRRERRLALQPKLADQLKAAEVEEQQTNEQFAAEQTAIDAQATDADVS